MNKQLLRFILYLDYALPDLGRAHARRVVAAIQAFGYRVLGGTAAGFAVRLKREVNTWTELVRRNRLSLV